MDTLSYLVLNSRISSSYRCHEETVSAFSLLYT
jgi:hypothetical protein